ncbi:MAG: fibrobacter succinogenes major paralogous domain-containing protein [Fibrobacter sp.]|nr:fibrobacter succinogenes major paralogous domain-containing protein [Fibrobacter sp.]
MKNFIAKMGAVLLASAAALVLSGCGEDSGTNANNRNGGAGTTMVDSRDGQAYKTVQIGRQTWMAENLNYQTGESKCYDNKPENCDKYGRLYVWREAVTACPDGWHLPSKEEFEELEKLTGQKVGTVLKSTTGWKDDDGKSGNGTDGLGFGALPAGYYNSNYDNFDFEGNNALFWSSTESNSYDAYYLFLFYDVELACVVYDNKNFGFSVRCVKNP